MEFQQNYMFSMKPWKVAYLPTEPGDYSINITFDDNHIPLSPFQAVIVPEDDEISSVKASGNGIRPHGTFRVRKCAVIRVDCDKLHKT